MTVKRALICGISGQDGGYLARLLLAKGYQVSGTSRDAEIGRFENLSKLGWTPKYSADDVIHMLVTARQRGTAE